ncbi:MAG: AmmeMemoRadiSam system radical SAM enzyme [Calditerrivibrio sp.]|nr:AmmeMemoRadiSam system radical SAM enzyme [Calditerrivibrio sp.]
MREAEFYSIIDGETVSCDLCPQRCIIKSGKSGLCLIRKNIGGKLYQTSYNEVSSLNVDPIEKKPLYHFHPGTSILSIGTNGCNLSCSYCQNFVISKNISVRNKVSKEFLLDIAKDSGSIGIAYTYNEPTVWYEFVYDCAEFFFSCNLKNVIVSNGFINISPLKKLSKYIDAANIDIKAFSEEGYRLLGGSLKPVLETVEFLLSENIHVEVTHLAVENYTTRIDEFEDMCRWLSNLNKHLPLHISRYFPCYKLSLPPTNTEFLNNLYDIGKKYLYNVYLGNLNFNNDSFCPYCGFRLVERKGYNVQKFIGDNICPSCKRELYFVL